MYYIIMYTTRIIIGIIEAHGWQYQFEVARHYYAMIPRLLEGSVNL